MHGGSCEITSSRSIMPATKAKLTQKVAPRRVTAFPTDLGWVAMIGHGDALARMVFGFESAEESLAALGPWRNEDVELGAWNKPLAARLQAYARGKRDDFSDVKLDLGSLTDFQRRVLAACRKVKYGKVATYASLAEAAGAPRAARAVGTVMSKNCIPVVIPCHRILSAGGGIGGYNCPQGLSMKKWLLAIEAQTVAKQPKAGQSKAAQPKAERTISKKSSSARPASAKTSSVKSSSTARRGKHASVAT